MSVITPIHAPEHRYQAPTDGTFQLASAQTHSKSEASDDELKKQIKQTVKRTDKLQRALYGEDKTAILCVFQAMDAAGKDSTIRAVTRGLNPAGFQVSSFKKPSANELEQDFLWRTARQLPQRGRIGIFNRSYYEEVLVLKVHPEWLGNQRLPDTAIDNDFWDARYQSINDHEQHLVNNGTVVLKFWLNVSKQEQANRFVDRIDNAKKHWKFSKNDIAERQYWDSYMKAYETGINATSTPWAPWYVIPADNKPYMRLTVAQIIEQTLTSIDPSYPTITKQHKQELKKIRQQLVD
ncbi:polyphosphate kinase 2 family protein [bacterium]|nr:polyphosphate kinase 2 family protein [bacterium]